MKTIKTLIFIILTSFIVFAVPVSAASLQENLATLNANWEDPLVIRQTKDELILSPKEDCWSKISVKVDGLYEPLHFYGEKEIKIDISSIAAGEHSMEVNLYNNKGESYKTFLGSGVVYSFVVGESRFAKYGIKYDNLALLSAIDPSLEATASEMVETMFSKFPILIGLIDSIVVEASTTDYYTKNPLSAAHTTVDGSLSITEDGKTKVGSTISLNVTQNGTSYLLKNNISHEMTHVSMFLRSCYALGIDPHDCNALEAYYASSDFGTYSYERNLRDKILISNGFSLIDISQEIRDYASTSNAEFFSNSIAQAITSQAPSKLSLIVLEELMKEDASLLQ